MTNEFKFDWVVVRKDMVGFGGDPSGPGSGPSSTTSRFDNLGLDSTSIVINSMTVDEAQEEEKLDSVLTALVNVPLRLIQPTRRQDVGGSVAAMSNDRVAGWVQDIGVNNSQSTGADVVVAVLDTGIDEGHPAFAGMDLVVQDFTGVGLGDADGHGTHCAATIFGRDVDGERIGVARGVNKALIAKVLGGPQSGSTATLVKALGWAQGEGADVISMSLGMDFAGYVQSIMKVNGLDMSQAIAIAMEAYRLNLEMFNKLSEAVGGVPGVFNGAVVVGACGNDSNNPAYSVAATLPANAKEFISVAALESDTAVATGYKLAKFSNTSAKIAAPGVAIRSAKAGGGLVSMDGTSMAAPIVSGVACLWTEHIRNTGAPTGAANVIDQLRVSARSLAPIVRPDQVRWGLVQAP